MSGFSASSPKFGFGGFSLLIGIVAFAIQQGCSLTGTSPNWRWGATWFFVAIALVVVAIWYWDRTATHHWIGKTLFTILVLGFMGVFSYIPIRKEFSTEHPIYELSAKDMEPPLENLRELNSKRQAEEVENAAEHNNALLGNKPKSKTALPTPAWAFRSSQPRVGISHKSSRFFSVKPNLSCGRTL
jgi:hypothetical protein